MALTPEEQARLWFEKQNQLQEQLTQSLGPAGEKGSPAPSPPPPPEQAPPQPEPAEDEPPQNDQPLPADEDIDETPEQPADIQKQELLDEPDHVGGLFAAEPEQPPESAEVDLDQTPSPAQPSHEPVNITLPASTRPSAEPDDVEIKLPNRPDEPSEFATNPDIRLPEMPEPQDEQEIDFQVPGFDELDELQAQDPSDEDMEFVLEDLAQTVTPDDDVESTSEPSAKPPAKPRPKRPAVSAGGSSPATLLLIGEVLLVVGWLVGLAVQVAELLRSLGAADSTQTAQPLTHGGLIAMGIALTAGWWLLTLQRTGLGAVMQWAIRITTLPVALLAVWPSGSAAGLAISAGAMLGFVLASLSAARLAGDLGRGGLTAQLRLLAGLIPLLGLTLAAVVRADLADALSPDGPQRTGGELLIRALRSPAAASALLAGLCLWQAGLYTRLAIWTRREKDNLA